MTRPFSVAHCSKQDFGAHMTWLHKPLLDPAFNSDVQKYRDDFARYLHDAMGWRADHYAAEQY